VHAHARAVILMHVGLLSIVQDHSADLLLAHRHPVSPHLMRSKVCRLPPASTQEPIAYHVVGAACWRGAHYWAVAESNDGSWVKLDDAQPVVVYHSRREALLDQERHTTTLVCTRDRRASTAAMVERCRAQLATATQRAIAA
jgi:hypothetical protein